MEEESARNGGALAPPGPARQRALSGEKDGDYMKLIRRRFDDERDLTLLLHGLQYVKDVEEQHMVEYQEEEEKGEEGGRPSKAGLLRPKKETKMGRGESKRRHKIVGEIHCLGPLLCHPRAATLPLPLSLAKRWHLERTVDNVIKFPGGGLRGLGGPRTRPISILLGLFRRPFFGAPLPKLYYIFIPLFSFSSFGYHYCLTARNR